VKAKLIQIRRLVVKRFLIIAIAGAVTLVAGIAVAMGASNAMGATSKGGVVSVKQISGKGSILVSAKGLALYTNNQDRQGMLVCNVACVSFWKPLTASKAPTISSLPGKFALVKRGSLKQVTYRGKPLYTFALDKSGQVSGDGAHDAFGGHNFTWHVVHAGKATSSQTTSTGTGTGPYGY
jgi:predicted lipoprotein with Yx(FWY)xxD motif